MWHSSSIQTNHKIIFSFVGIHFMQIKFMNVISNHFSNLLNSGLNEHQAHTNICVMKTHLWKFVEDRMMESETINRNIELASEFEIVVGDQKLEKFQCQIILIVIIPISWKYVVRCNCVYGNGVDLLLGNDINARHKTNFVEGHMNCTM